MMPKKHFTNCLRFVLTIIAYYNKTAPHAFQHEGLFSILFSLERLFPLGDGSAAVVGRGLAGLFAEEAGEVVRGAKTDTVCDLGQGQLG